METLREDDEGNDEVSLKFIGSEPDELNINHQ
jgi:hypothetical protein